MKDGKFWAQGMNDKDEMFVMSRAWDKAKVWVLTGFKPMNSKQPRTAYRMLMIWHISLLFSCRKSSTAQQSEKPDILGRRAKKANMLRCHQQAEKAGVVLTWLGIHLSQLSAVLQSQPELPSRFPVVVHVICFSFLSACKLQLLNWCLTNMEIVIVYKVL